MQRRRIVWFFVAFVAAFALANFDLFYASGWSWLLNIQYWCLVYPERTLGAIAAGLIVAWLGPHAARRPSSQAGEHDLSARVPDHGFDAEARDLAASKGALDHVREFVMDWLFGPKVVWPTLILLTFGFAFDWRYGDSQISGILGASNWVLLAGLAICWWVVWIGEMTRRSDDRR